MAARLLGTTRRPGGMMRHQAFPKHRFLSHFAYAWPHHASCGAAMNEIDPSLRFTADAVRSHDGAIGRSAARSSTIWAEQVAFHFRDNLSPIMVTGLSGWSNWPLLALSGPWRIAYYVGLSTHLVWHYPVYCPWRFGADGHPVRHWARLSAHCAAPAVRRARQAS